MADLSNNPYQQNYGNGYTGPAPLTPASYNQGGAPTTQPGIYGLGNQNVGAAGGPGNPNEINYLTGDPGNTVIQALMGMGPGFFPGSRTPMMKGMLSHASDIVNTVLARMASNGGGLEQFQGGAGQDAFLGAVRQLLAEGAKGARTLGGFPQGVLDQLNARAEAANAGQDTSFTGQLLSTLLSDPNKAIDFASSLLYSGNPTPLANMMTSQLGFLAPIYQQAALHGQIAPTSTALSLLQRLLSEGPQALGTAMGQQNGPWTPQYPPNRPAPSPAETANMTGGGFGEAIQNAMRAQASGAGAY